jgi:hypothetical protein
MALFISLVSSSSSKPAKLLILAFSRPTWQYRSIKPDCYVSSLSGLLREVAHLVFDSMLPFTLSSLLSELSSETILSSCLGSHSWPILLKRCKLIHQPLGFLASLLLPILVSDAKLGPCQLPTFLLASAVLVSSNPTNLVLSGAFSISYFTYTAKIIVPVVVAAIIILPVLLFLFRKPGLIPREIKPITLSPRSVLLDPFGGIFGGTMLILTLCTLVGTSILHPQVFLVTVPPAIIVFIRDVLYDLRRYRRQVRKVEGDPAPTVEKPPATDSADIEMGTRERPVAEAVEPQYPTGMLSHQTSRTLIVPQEDKGGELTPQNQATKDLVKPEVESNKSSPSNILYQMFPTVISILKLMPFSLVLFSLSMFILVQGLGVNGWVDVWAHWWGAWVNRTGAVGTVFGMGLVSCILCNVRRSFISQFLLLTDNLSLSYLEQTLEQRFSWQGSYKHGSKHHPLRLESRTEQYLH